MPYATRQQMENIVGKNTYLTVVPGGDARLQDTAADEALESASAVADTYIARWLPLPTPTPPALRDAVIWIATYTLAGDLWTEHMLRKHDGAMKWLADIASGKASLGVLSTPAASGGSAQLEARDRRMTRRTLAGVL